jgi:DNA ligase-4
MEASGSTAEAAVPLRKSEDACNKIPFQLFCTMLNKVSAARGRDTKLDILFRPEMRQEMAGGSLYPLMRLVLPDIDSERGNYDLKHAMIAKTYVNALHLDKSSQDALRLLNWKDPTQAQKSSVEASRMYV